MKRKLTLLFITLSLIVFNQSCKEPVPEKVEPGTIKGYVTDKATNEPIENVNILLNPGEKSTTTNSEGYYEFTDLEPKDYSFTASKNAYKDYEYSQSITVKEAEVTTHDFEMEKLSTSLSIVDAEGNEINELNYGNLNDDVTRTFNLLNDGEMPLNYQINNSSSWIVNISEAEGLLSPDSLKCVTITIDRNLLAIGENETVLNITSDGINLELTVRAYKSVNVVTLEASEVGTTSAVLKGSIILEGRSLTEKGFVLYIDENNMTEYVVPGNEIGEFSYQVSDLLDGQTYCYKAYMIFDDEVVYGEEKCFATEKIVVLPSVVVYEVSEITQTTASCEYEITDNGGAEITSRGVCWSTSHNPTIEENHTSDGSGTGSFTSNLSNLVPQTTYYVRAYATNSFGTAYSEEKTFTTLEEVNEINGYEYVDLGLPSGLKWATHNIGATTAEGYGEYYAWGEIETKTTYTQGNSVTYGIDIDDISGNPQYDVARAKWGSTWRIPTKEEQKELVDNCTWEWTTQNGVNGYVVTGSNGNSIFLPAAGFYENSSLNEVGEYGYYWSSTPQTNTLGAYYLYMSNTSYMPYYYARVAGQSVRAVSE